MARTRRLLFLIVSLLAFVAPVFSQTKPVELRVGVAAAELAADDSMIIAGGITAGKASGQEGKLRCVATVLEKDGVRLAIVACDVLMMTRATLDPVIADIQRSTGISASNILINC
ncbi:MAG TPA: hypothetical protein VK615_09820, partial [Candidatus Binatia bacterium]|nr:hypothetical protein [Candidatus Binatia bacterium]